MIVVQPGDYERETQLLPGTPERKEKLVGSLEELKAQMDEDNARNNRRTRIINKAVIAASIISIIGLFVADHKIKEREKVKFNQFGEMEGSLKKGGLSEVWKFLRWIGKILSIGAFLHGVHNVSNTITVIEPKTEEIEKKYSAIKIKSNEKQSLRDLTVKATLDSLIQKRIISKSRVQNRIRAFKSNPNSVKNKAILNSILKYEPSR